MFFWFHKTKNGVSDLRIGERPVIVNELVCIGLTNFALMRCHCRGLERGGKI